MSLSAKATDSSGTSVGEEVTWSAAAVGVGLDLCTDAPPADPRASPPERNNRHRQRRRPEGSLAETGVDLAPEAVAPGTAERPSEGDPDPSVRWIGQTEVLALILLTLVLGRGWIRPLFDNEALRTWCTMFVAVVVQSTPFLVGGVLVSTCISRMVSERFLQRVIPNNPVLAVPVAGLAGVGLPGCECAAVPVTEGLMRRGLSPAVALTFLLAAPAINPAVIVSTTIAFPGNHRMVVARISASLITAVVVGWWCLLRGDRLGIRRRIPQHDHAGTFLEAALHDFLHASGFLMAGAMAAAAINTFVPRHIVDTVAGHALLGIGTLALFAFFAALCSESDAFVAASLTDFSNTAKLAFLVVGPAMDLKLAAMESGQFGFAFARQFVPTVLFVALASAVAVAWCLL